MDNQKLNEWEVIKWLFISPTETMEIVIKKINRDQVIILLILLWIAITFWKSFENENIRTLWLPMILISIVIGWGLIWWTRIAFFNIFINIASKILWWKAWYYNNLKAITVWYIPALWILIIDIVLLLILWVDFFTFDMGTNIEYEYIYYLYFFFSLFIFTYCLFLLSIWISTVNKFSKLKWFFSIILWLIIMIALILLITLWVFNMIYK